MEPDPDDVLGNLAGMIEGIDSHRENYPGLIIYWVCVTRELATLLKNLNLSVVEETANGCIVTRDDL